MDTSLIMEKVYAVIDDIKQSPEYLNLKMALDNLMSDSVSAKLIQDFNLKKKDYEKNPIDPQTIRALSDVKKTLYQNSLYQLYDKALIVYNVKMKSLEDSINNALYPKELKEIAKCGCLKQHDQKR